ncbi:P-loop containing nucleoside triphosphate hydrolase protein [Lentithecium fluviatile CBS 122367]|uniref:P-loop containing nucleoside triphosphate hydrolase protein n=1 Tax=Lentithecium fluviatile CBS 122367 TaxID=1168545 RepID=A0A6G1ISU7_9PLEO|nr:P-loop containing nucleoside triphosphate hydrolase protein [Lentithecium fluviatile CBS 122367]
MHDHGASDQCAYDESKEVVCFGVVPSIEARCENRNSSTHPFAVHLNSSESFSSVDPPERTGFILPQHRYMIEGLLNEATLVLHAVCILETASKNRSLPTVLSQVSCTLEVAVYGPYELFDEIGEWFQEYNVYLQDPHVCHSDVRYCNPHRLSVQSLHSSPYLSQVVAQASMIIHFQELVERPDLLDIISGQEDLVETLPSILIKTTLHRHQKQALTFMLRRERGWRVNDAWPDIWETLETSYARRYINRITDQHQDETPLPCHGGIIADPMGLGKTLTMIALATDNLAKDVTIDDRWCDVKSIRSVAATLIIVPQPLLSTWEEQITEHVVPGGIHFRRHHGKTRLTDLEELNAIHVVLTTYHTISADWKGQKTNAEGHLMFSVRWKRIVLDEAHLIRNTKTRMARAICELEADCRWAVTGTPVQNHLNDLAALLKFIRAYPYDDHKRFDSDISHLWKADDAEEAVKRLKRLSRCLILRRAKKTIDLPPRHDVKCPVDFSRAEKAVYDSIREQTITKIDDALLHDTELSKSGAYVNFLQQIESMRLVCNLGLHYHTRHDKGPTQTATDWPATAQKAFNIQREMETIICSQCASSLEMSEGLLDDTFLQDSPLFSRCLKYACAECSQKLRITGHKMVCGHTPRCPVAPVSTSNSELEETFSQASIRKPEQPVVDNGLPSKVRVLVSDLKALPIGVKSIVFSTWRLTLDIVEAGLNQAGIQCARFDGKVPQAQRQPVLNQFKTDPNIRVMLLTLQCGAVGLTLTEASRAYLMEPHWNPTIEEQALARIHRIGQKREVTTIRFYIRDSFEERVMEVQESKKNLAGILLSGHDGGQADDSLGALQVETEVIAVKQDCYTDLYGG